MKRKVWSDKVKVEFLESIIKSFFGYNSKIEYCKWAIEPPNIEIHDVDLDEDLLGILDKVRGNFSLEFHSSGEWYEYEKGKKCPIGVLEITLWKREKV